MGQSRVTSFFLSLCLHAAVIAAALFWPESSRPPVDLNMPMLDLNLTTIGKPGARAVQPVAKPVPDTPKTAPEAPQTPPDKPIAPPAEAKKPDPVPVKPDVKPVPAPTPPPDAKPISETPQKIEPPVNATKTAQPDPKPVAKPAEKPEDVLKKALGDLGKNAPKAPAGPSGRPDPNSVKNALGDFKKSGSGSDASGDGPGGEGGDGIGVVGSYQQSLASRIKPYWEYAGRADRKNPTAVVTISIAKDGSIIDAALAQSSGDAAFDGSVIKAVKDTGKVEPPPTPNLMKVNITFAYEALAATR